MSAQFKNAKKKLSQTELRRIMNEHKNKIKIQPKINSPLAKYNEVGQLTCVLCQSVVRSEAVWAVHINSKQHKEKVEHAKKLKEKTNNFTTPVKRSLTPPLVVSASSKKLKSILKNSTSSTNENVEDVEEMQIESNGLPKDFFDNAKVKQSPKTKEVTKTTNIDDGKKQDDPIPEGFFDDPIQDAKARNVDYKDPIEEEWEKFQKAIRDADTESATIIAEDQQVSTNERQIEEIEEQLNNWSRVLTLEKMKSEVVSAKGKNWDNMDDSEGSDIDEKDFDEFFDWRSKKSFS